MLCRQWQLRVTLKNKNMRTVKLNQQDHDTYRSCSGWQCRPLVEIRGSALLRLDAPAQVSSTCSHFLTPIWVCGCGAELNPDLAHADRWQGFASGLFGRCNFGDHGHGSDSQVPCHSPCGCRRVGGPTAGAGPQTPTDKGNFHCWVGSAHLWKHRDVTE